MTAERTFTGQQAGLITGVSGMSQREWRRRKLLPVWGETRAVRYAYEEVARLRLMRLFAEKGMLLGKAAQLAEHLAGSLGYAFAAALASQARGGPFAETAAVLITRPDESEITEAVEIFSLGDLALLDLQRVEEGQTRNHFQHVELIDLAGLAHEMAENVREMDERAQLLTQIGEALERVDTKMERLERSSKPPPRLRRATPRTAETEPEPAR